MPTQSIRAGRDKPVSRTRPSIRLNKRDLDEQGVDQQKERDTQKDPTRDANVAGKDESRAPCGRYEDGKKAKEPRGETSNSLRPSESPERREIEGKCTGKPQKPRKSVYPGQTPPPADREHPDRHLKYNTLPLKIQLIGHTFFCIL